MSEESRDDRYADVDTSHLDDVADGCGCTEIWEHTSERESDAASEDAEDADAEEAPEADAAD